MSGKVPGVLPGGELALANGACFLGIALWSFGFPAMDVLLETWGAVALALTRMAIGVSILVAAWRLMDGLSALASAPWRRGIWIGGIGFGVGTTLLTVGQDYSDTVTPAIAVAMMPIAGAMIEMVFDKRRLRANTLGGIALALIGGYLATGVRLEDGQFGIGAAMCLAAVLLFAWATRATTRELPGLSAVGQTAVTLVGAMIVITVILGLGAVSGSPHAQLGTSGRDGIVLMLIASVPALAVAQLLWIWSARRLGILLASMHMNALPFYVMVIVAVGLGESWHWDQAFGAALVAAGVLIAQMPARVRA